jgi:hypothetical protein
MTPGQPSMRERRVSDRPVRFLFALLTANDHKFLVVLDEQSGGPSHRRTKPRFGPT